MNMHLHTGLMISKPLRPIPFGQLPTCESSARRDSSTVQLLLKITGDWCFHDMLTDDLASTSCTSESLPLSQTYFYLEEVEQVLIFSLTKLS